MNECKICKKEAEHADKINEFLLDLDSNTLEKLSNFFKITGDQTRLKILIALIENPKNVSILATELEMSLSAISHQLRVLREAKLVKNKKIGKEVYYDLDDDHIKLILDMAIDHIKEH